MTDALEGQNGTINMGGRNITNLRFADDTDEVAGSEDELADLVKRLEETSSRYGMEINTEKTKLMTNSTDPIKTKIIVNSQQLETVKQFKTISEGAKPEVLAILKPIWMDTNITPRTKLKLLHALVLSIFLYACETWILTAELQRRMAAIIITLARGARVKFSPLILFFVPRWGLRMCSAIIFRG